MQDVVEVAEEHVGVWHVVYEDTVLRQEDHALEKVPDWSWDPRADEFAEYLHLANTYAQQHGNHCSPPSHMPKITCRDGIAWDLGSWVRDKRSEFKASKLSRDRIEALEKVPGWSWTSK
jgi:hypothetical protein